MVLLLSRCLTICEFVVVWLAFLMTAGIVAQVAIGGATPEIGLYLQTIFGLQLVDCLLFALLALLVWVNQKFVGHLVALVIYGCIAFASTLGIEHKLLISYSLFSTPAILMAPSKCWSGGNGKPV